MRELRARYRDEVIALGEYLDRDFLDALGLRRARLSDHVSVGASGARRGGARERQREQARRGR